MGSFSGTEATRGEDSLERVVEKKNSRRDQYPDAGFVERTIGLEAITRNRISKNSHWSNIEHIVRSFKFPENIKGARRMFKGIGGSRHSM
jgi:hypothetical protein